MLYKVFDFADKEVSDVMVPRPEVVAISIALPPEEALKAVLESPYTRYPVYRESLDDIVGVLHIRDLIEAMHDRGIVVGRPRGARPAGVHGPGDEGPRRAADRVPAHEPAPGDRDRRVRLDGGDRHARGPARGDRRRDRGRVRPAGRDGRAHRRRHDPDRRHVPDRRLQRAVRLRPAGARTTTRSPASSSACSAARPSRATRSSTTACCSRSTRSRASASTGSRSRSSRGSGQSSRKTTTPRRSFFAPGRVNLIGEYTDLAGGLALPGGDRPRCDARRSSPAAELVDRLGRGRSGARSARPRSSPSSATVAAVPRRPHVDAADRRGAVVLRGRARRPDARARRSRRAWSSRAWRSGPSSARSVSRAGSSTRQPRRSAATGTRCSSISTRSRSSTCRCRMALAIVVVDSGVARRNAEIGLRRAQARAG